MQRHPWVALHGGGRPCAPAAAPRVRYRSDGSSGKDPPRDASHGVAGQAVADRRHPPVTRAGT